MEVSEKGLAVAAVVLGRPNCSPPAVGPNEGAAVVVETPPNCSPPDWVVVVPKGATVAVNEISGNF